MQKVGLPVCFTSHREISSQINSVYSNSNTLMGNFKRKGKHSYLDGLRRESTLFEDFVEPCKTKTIIMQNMYIIYNPLTRVIQIQIERHKFTVAMVMENISGFRCKSKNNSGVNKYIPNSYLWGYGQYPTYNRHWESNMFTTREGTVEQKKCVKQNLFSGFTSRVSHDVTGSSTINCVTWHHWREKLSG